MADQQPNVTTSPPAETFVCHACAAENFIDADFCGHCGAPISGFATIDPLRQIHATGWMYRRAIAGRQRPIIFWGMWLIFGPTVILAAIALIVGIMEFDFTNPFASVYTALDSKSSHPIAFGETSQGQWDVGELVGIVFGGFIILLYVAILAKVTKRYIQNRRTELVEAAADDPDT